jgi:iron complex transport system ATP-binding protein
MGSGAVLYRLLSKHGYRIHNGVLHHNDLDCFVARSLDAICITQEPAETIAATALEKAATELQKCDLVVDAGFTTGGVYHNNLTLIEQATAASKPIFSLRSESGPCLSPGCITTCTTPNQLLEILEQTYGKHQP